MAALLHSGVDALTAFASFCSELALGKCPGLFVHDFIVPWISSQVPSLTPTRDRAYPPLSQSLNYFRTTWLHRFKLLELLGPISIQTSCYYYLVVSSYYTKCYCQFCIVYY